MSSSQSKPYQSSLESVVASLVKSTEKLSDEEYDRYIADLILKEAQGSSENVATSSAPSSARAASTNKQFLASMIRNVDGHNRHLIRAQLQAARKGNRERAEHGTSRIRSPVRSSGNRMRGWSDDEDQDAGTSRSPDRERPSTSRRARSPPRRQPAIESKMDKYFSESYNPVLDTTPDYAPDSKSHSRRAGSRGDKHTSSKSRSSREDRDARPARRDRRDDSSDESHRRRKHRRSDDRDDDKYRVSRRDKDDDDTHGTRIRRSDKRRREDDTSSRKSHRSSRDDRERDRHRKFRHRSTSPSSISPERRPKSSSRRRHRHHSSSPAMRSSPENAPPTVGSSVMDTTYAKRGAVREWDLGKDKREGKELMP